MAIKDIKGVIPPMITPFRKNGEVDYNAHGENIHKWNKTNLCGYLVLGSNSETVYLNEQEKLKLIDITVKEAAQDRLLLAGTGLESARETIALTNKAADLGIQAALILTPSYYIGQMGDASQIKYFTEVADKSSIPILIYNVTKFTRINISAHAVKVLSQHPNIAGMKDSSGNIPQLVNFLRVIDADFEILVGTASAWYPALTLGIKAGIFALSNCAPNECAQVQELFENGNLEKAKELYTRIFPVNTAVTATFGIPGLKYASELMGYKGGQVRTPLLPLDDDQKNKIRDILLEARLL